MIPALFSGIRRQIVGTAQRKVRRKRQRGSRGRECVCVREIACARLSHCPVFPKPARFFRISLYWTTFHHYVRAWDRLRDRQRERERGGGRNPPLSLFLSSTFFLSAPLFCATLDYLNTWNRPRREETPRSRKKNYASPHDKHKDQVRLHSVQ